MSTGDALPLEITHHVRDTCINLHVQRAARAVARRFDDALRPIGLTSGQFSLLMSLNRPRPPAIAPVAQLLGMNRTTLTAALKPLERDGLVVIEVDPQDRRSRLLRLTEAGHAVLARAVPIWRRTHAEAQAALGEGGAERLRSALVALS